MCSPADSQFQHSGLQTCKKLAIREGERGEKREGGGKRGGKKGGEGRGKGEERGEERKDEREERGRGEEREFFLSL